MRLFYESLGGEENSPRLGLFGLLASFLVVFGGDQPVFCAPSASVGPSPGVAVCVIDTGVDFTEPCLGPAAWIAPTPSPGFVGEISGWNFRDNNAMTYDARAMHPFDQARLDQMLEFQRLQKERIEGRIRSADLRRLTELLDDEEFLRQHQSFGVAVHGTHVAGIIAKPPRKYLTINEKTNDALFSEETNPR